MNQTQPLVVALKTLTLLLGALITYYAYAAYRRTGSSALRALAAGFAVVTLGSILAGLADQVFVVSRSYALVVESSLTALGFGIIVYALYAE